VTSAVTRAALFAELLRACPLLGVEHRFDLRAGLLTERAVRLTVLRPTAERFVALTRLLEDPTHLRDLIRAQRELLGQVLHAAVEALLLVRLTERLRALALLGREDRLHAGAHRLARGEALFAGLLAPSLTGGALLGEDAAELLDLRGRELQLLSHVLQARLRIAVATATTVVTVLPTRATRFGHAGVGAGDASVLRERGESGGEGEGGSEDEVLHGDFLSRHRGRPRSLERTTSEAPLKRTGRFDLF